MDVRRRALGRRGWVIAGAVVVLCVGAGLTYQQVTAVPEHSSSVTFFVHPTASDPSDAVAADRMTADRMTAVRGMVTSDELANRVIADTGVPLTAAEVSSRMTGEVQAGTVLLTATVTDSSAERALAIAQAVATNFDAVANDLDPSVAADVSILVVTGPTLG